MESLNCSLNEAITIGLGLFIFFFFFLYKLRSNGRKLKLPPGPRPWPVVGNLHLLGNLPHQALAALAKKYGPILLLRLGSVPTVVVSSPAMAKEFLKPTIWPSPTEQCVHMGNMHVIIIKMLCLASMERTGGI
ncbi:hypothetical protein SUGI_0100090 [Cryptomeria japonica]|nr:hypothetical protein SUGI_0100090 [Cryptomeria japonica]